MRGLLKLVVVVAIVLLVWKKGVPWFESHFSGKSAALSTSDSANTTCIELAEHASEAWGSGVSRFANPPYDLSAWGEFRSRVDAAVAKAESVCNCSDDACTKAHKAMEDLRGLVSECDTAFRGGTSPPSDIVQRQEQIDNTINAARDSLRGK